MEILFVGSLYSEEYKKQFINLDDSGHQEAAAALQWNIIKGLEANLGKSLDILSAFLQGGKLKKNYMHYIPDFAWAHNTNAHDYIISFWDFRGIRGFSVAKSLKMYTYKWCKLRKEPFAIILYSAFFPFLLLVKYIKKMFPKAIVCLIVADLPEYMTLEENKGTYKKLATKYSSNIIYKNLEYVDCFVILTDQMKYPLCINNRPYTVIEGMVDTDEVTVKDFSKIMTEKIILYTGTLHKQFGILTLLEAFSKIIDLKYRLYLCGEGDAKEQVEKAVENDNRIKYFGVVTREKALALQKQATVLVNPRNNEGEYTKYSFPSKTMEYLKSGTPVIGHRLDGIPKEYDPYINYIENDNSACMAQTIIKICSMSQQELQEIGNKGRAFVLKKKSHVVQTKKILEMLDIFQGKGLPMDNLSPEVPLQY